MNRKSAWALGVAASGLVAYGLWRVGRRPIGEAAVPASGPRSADQAVDEASEDSFPASDPPSYTPTSGTRMH